MFFAAIIGGINTVYAGRFDQQVAMRESGASTFYVDAHIEGFGKIDFMVDTGASYTTINEATLGVLKKNGHAAYLRELNGVLADGSKVQVSVYKISSIKIGKECTLKEIEAAVFPGKTRHILGISALRKASPFVFSMEPPALLLSNCAGNVSERMNNLSGQAPNSMQARIPTPPPLAWEAAIQSAN